MKVVKVLWVNNCNSNINWTVAEDIKIKPMYIDSFGVVVKDTDEFLVIAQNYSDNPEQYSNIITIPKCCIKELFVIHEDNICEKNKKTNNIEPKFKVGDKIQYSKGCGTIMTIEKIENDEYIFSNNMGHTTIESGNKWHLVEQKPARRKRKKLR